MENNNKVVFCTIITSNYLHYAYAVYHSLLKFNSNFDFHIFFYGKIEKYNLIEKKNLFHSNLEILKNQTKNSIEIFEQYDKKDNDRLRWSLKPTALIYLLQKSYTKAFYLDSDLFFTNNYNFLIDELDSNNVILTPHFRTIKPTENYTEFRALFNDGLYNAGFFGVNKNGIDALHWWEMANNYKCEINHFEGFHDDQNYLSIMPIYFNNVKVIKHLGCNLGYWNIEYCKRNLSENGEVKINNIFDVIFIHFAPKTIKLIEDQDDKYLEKFLKEYNTTLYKYFDFCKIEQKKKKHFSKVTRAWNNFYTKLKNKYINRMLLFIYKRFN